MRPVIVCVMGVAGSGKSTVGSPLADRLHCEFLDADSLHSPANIRKMSSGIPLTDADRAPWLDAIHQRILLSAGRRECLVLACSALKQRYRDTLSQGVPVTWVYLKGSRELILDRLRHRPDHYMKPEMLDSQFADLEQPTDAIVADVAEEPSAIVDRIIAALPRE